MLMAVKSPIVVAALGVHKDVAHSNRALPGRLPPNSSFQPRGWLPKMLTSIRDPSSERLVETIGRRTALRGDTCVGNVASCHEEVGPGLARWLGFGRRARP